MSSTVTSAIAQAELDRRAHNRSTTGKRIAAKNEAARQMTGDELRTIAGPQKPVKQAPKARKVGAGSRGGDPVKALRSQVASSLDEQKGSNGWWQAYRATKGMTEVELRSSLAAFAQLDKASA